MRDITKLFITQQYASEIAEALTNKEIDRALTIGVKILSDAKDKLVDGSYTEQGLTKEEVELDIKRIEYNLGEFTGAFLKSENMEVLTEYEVPMFYHMN
jgi:hypothetical protein